MIRKSKSIFLSRTSLAVVLNNTLSSASCGSKNNIIIAFTTNGITPKADTPIATVIITGVNGTVKKLLTKEILFPQNFTRISSSKIAKEEVRTKSAKALHRASDVILSSDIDKPDSIKQAVSEAKKILLQVMEVYKTLLYTK
jgi:hypothetical protein